MGIGGKWVVCNCGAGSTEGPHPRGCLAYSHTITVDFVPEEVMAEVERLEQSEIGAKSRLNALSDKPIAGQTFQIIKRRP